MKSIKALSLLVFALSALSFPALSFPALSAETIDLEPLFATGIGGYHKQDPWVDVTFWTRTMHVVWIGKCHYQGIIDGEMQASLPYVACVEEGVAKAELSENALLTYPMPSHPMKLIPDSNRSRYRLKRLELIKTISKNKGQIEDLLFECNNQAQYLESEKLLDKEMDECKGL